MPRGTSPKREREYQALQDKFKKSGRYKGREEEVAARIVNKQRRLYGETQAEKAKDQAGQSPDRHLPIADYQHLTVPEIRSKISKLSPAQLRQVARYEHQHKHRRTLLADLQQRLAA